MYIFDFILTEDEMAQIRALDTGAEMHDPDRPGLREMYIKAFDVHAND